VIPAFAKTSGSVMIDRKTARIGPTSADGSAKSTVTYTILDI
jgi:hypothetical protein